MSAEYLFKIRSSALPDDAMVAGFKGREAISEPYSFEIGIVTSDRDWNHDDAVMARATLQMGSDSAPYLHSGIFAAVELLHEFDGRLLYRAILVPKLWQLTLTRHSNVWTDKSIPTILQEVLEWSGLTSNDFELRLKETYPKREFVAQYKEDNLSFISRWMERLGIFYYFEQGDDAEKLVLVDTKSYDDETPNPEVRYVPGAQGDAMVADGFWVFRSRTSAMPASMELLDYDYQNPRLDVRGTAPVLSTGFGEISRFGDDNFLTPNEGNRLATIRAQELLARRKVMHAQGRTLLLFPGWPFTLVEHPRSDLCDKTFLVRSIAHVGNGAVASALSRDLLGIETDKAYSCEVSAILDGVQFRPRCVHEWPRIEGYESATVCGASGSQYAQIDDHGRYKVRVMFDESDLGDGKASAWVRMQQPYGGNPEGFHFPLIKGTEVLLWFMGGDPDRPVIAGVAPNRQNPSLITINNNTTNVIQTINLNIIELIDTVNEMTIRISCPISNTYLKFGFDPEFQIILNTEANAHFFFGGLFLLDVKATWEANVDLDVTFNFNSNWICNIAVDNNITIDGDMNLTVAGDVNWQIGGDWNVNIDGDANLTIAGDVNVDVGGDNNITIGANQNIDIGVNQVVNIGGNQNITIGGDQNLTITGKQNIDVLSDWKWNVLGHEITAKMANSTEITIGLKNEVFIGMKNSLFVGGQMNATLALMMELKAAAAISLTLGNYLQLKGANELNITAGSIINIDAGLRLGIHGGAAISIFGGVKMSIEAGVELKLEGGPNLEVVPIKLIV